MLTYLDSLYDALVARDVPRLRHLVDGHPLARLLPADALAEVRRFVAGRVRPHAVPMAVLRFRDQTARLLSEAPRGEVTADSASPSAPRSTRRRRGRQMELPLSA
jgi:hypothetical protein